MSFIKEDVMSRKPQHNKPSSKRPTGILKSRRRALSLALSEIPENGLKGSNRTVAVFFRERGADSASAKETAFDRLELSLLHWAWHARYGSWFSGVRALARALRGLEETGLI